MVSYLSSVGNQQSIASSITDIGQELRNKSKNLTKHVRLQATLCHVLINQEPLVFLHAITYQAHKIFMVQHDQHETLHQELLVPLHPLTIQLLDRHDLLVKIANIK